MPISRVIRVFKARRRMVIAVVVGVGCGWLVPESRSAVTRGLIGWNVGVWLYLALVAHLMAVADHHRMRRAAVAHSEGARVVLAVVVLAAIISVAAIISELSTAKGGGARTAVSHVLFALSTVAGSWVLLPTLFTLNYASLFYLPTIGGGLAFPTTDKTFNPDYSDFAYFAFTIAVASQTSDVTVTSRRMRRLVLVQSILSFVFNTTILALTINMAAGLF